MRPSKSLRVAFQGERGAFSEEAAVKLLGPRIALVPRPTFDSLFRAVEERAADCILAPIENSLAGSVQPTYDLLLQRPLHITAEVVIPIRHNLIACPRAAFRQIRSVESHPVALAQCQRFFTAHPHIRRIATDDTAGSVREVLHRGNPARAAIAGTRAARIYGGKILRRDLQDHRANYTRFVLLSPDETPRATADKLSLVIRLAHRPGALHRALQPFARRGVNLLKIESRPITGRPWQYHFYLDLKALADDKKVVAALKELHARTDHVRTLGWYPAARAVGSRNDHKGARSW